jgi:hypothetical protein
LEAKVVVLLLVTAAELDGTAAAAEEIAEEATEGAVEGAVEEAVGEAVVELLSVAANELEVTVRERDEAPGQRESAQSP